MLTMAAPKAFAPLRLFVRPAPLAIKANASKIKTLAIVVVRSENWRAIVVFHCNVPALVAPIPTPTTAKDMGVVAVVWRLGPLRLIMMRLVIAPAIAANSVRTTAKAAIAPIALHSIKTPIAKVIIQLVVGMTKAIIAAAVMAKFPVWIIIAGIINAVLALPVPKVVMMVLIMSMTL